MSEFNFNSQVCTSKIQSERLIALGLKKETADCCYYYYDGEYLIAFAEDAKYESDIPAWSLHRLFQIYLNGMVSSSWNMAVFNWDDLIDCIESRIKNGCFNKEYLV